MTFLVPEHLHTQRLSLRIPVEADWANLHEYYSDIECMRYTVGKALNEGESWRAMASLLGHWQLRGYGTYSIIRKSTHLVVGIAGLDFPNDWPEPEIAWGLSRKYWGKGYASEAVREIKQLVAGHIPDLNPISLIHPKNSNSVNLAAAVGAKFEKDYFFRDDTWSIYRHQFGNRDNDHIRPRRVA